ncbi:MAG TPA: hypothetical protein VGN13_08910 [Solirubrobacteraceae bacterium]|jgi:hypothetical protein
MMRAISEANMGRRVGVLALLAVLVVVGVYVSTSSGRPSRPARRAGSAARSSAARTVRPGATAAPATSAAPASAPPAPPPPPRLVVSAPAHVGSPWTTVARVHGLPAAWVSEKGGVTLMRFDQALVHLTLHAGSSDGGERGWTYGDRIGPREIHSLVAAFNGGFKLTYRDVGFVSGHHVAVPLKAGLASIVTYTNGRTDIGAWRAGVPRAGTPVFSVLQNQQLLVDRGAAAANVDSCVVACWGETIGSATSVARSALGISRSGQLIWAAGEQLTPGPLARALIAAGAVRAIELDINPFWVAGYLYPHHPSGPTAVPVVPGQHGIAGELLEADSRDFFAIVANY